MDIIRKNKIGGMIFDIMRDFKPLVEDINDLTYETISHSNYNPPAYMIQILFLSLLKYQDYGPLDKVRWHTFFKYKNTNYMIRDYKFGSWSIESDSDDIENNVVEEIKRKILVACNNLNKILKDELIDHIEDRNYYIMNYNRTLYHLYTFYLEKTKEVISTSKKLTLSNEKLICNQDVFSYLYSTMNAFYSYLEFILDSIFAFKEIDMIFFDFKGCTNIFRHTFWRYFPRYHYITHI